MKSVGVGSAVFPAELLPALGGCQHSLTWGHTSPVTASGHIASSFSVFHLPPPYKDILDSI